MAKKSKLEGCYRLSWLEQQGPYYLLNCEKSYSLDFTLDKLMEAIQTAVDLNRHSGVRQITLEKRTTRDEYVTIEVTDIPLCLD